jgi:hypothetical protein
VTIDAHSAVALLSPISVTLEVKSVTVTLDEAWSPYCQAALVCSMPSPEDREAIDLRDGDIYLDLRLRQDFGAPWTIADITADVAGDVSDMTALVGGQPVSFITNRYYEPWNGSSVRPDRKRFFTLLVTERTFDDVANELTITATSLESLLLGDALLSTTPLDPASTSLRTIVQSVLNRYGEVLDTAALDATVAEATSTVWQPGVGAWEYVDPMLEAASLRLWCNEAGVFTISTRQATTPGSATITPTGTMTGLVDRMSNDPSIWYDGVVVEYRWVDAFDLNQVAYDVAGSQPAKSVLRVERTNTIYPGPGAAAGILDRGQGRGRVLDVTAINDYTLSPGMPATITPLDTEAQNGYLSALTWRLPDAEMDVSSRGLVDTPDTAYLYGPVGASYLDVPLGIDYLEFEWSMV